MSEYLEHSHPVPKSKCPDCGNRLSMASKMKGSGVPREGDVTICVFCASILFFDRGLFLRKATDSERADVLQRSPNTRRLLRAVVMGIQKRN